jgi:hypothetical protein
MTPPPKGPPVKKTLIIPSSSRRDLIIAVGAGLAVLALVIFMMVSMSKVPGSPSTNQLTGVILAKHYSGEKEKEITFGRKGLKEKETDSGYSFDVRVDPPGKIYEVPVSKLQYTTAKVGDKQSFIRPPSEQR